MLTRDVERVVRSRYAGRLFVYTEAEHSSDATNDAEKDSSSASEGTTGAEQSPSTPDARAASSESEAGGAVDDPAPLIDSEFSPAPVEHFADGREGEGALLLDYAYGEGRIVLLSDPYMISNAGLSRADNLQLAVNIVAGSGGLIAFDEYHHGHGASRNRTFAYFAGTPMLAFAGQAALIAARTLSSSPRWPNCSTAPARMTSRWKTSTVGHAARSRVTPARRTARRPLTSPRASPGAPAKTRARLKIFCTLVKK